LQGRDAHTTAFSAFALLKWQEMKASPVTERLTSRLISLLGENLVRGLSMMLWAAGQMYAKGYLSDDDVELLVESVHVIFDSTNYKNIDPSSLEAVTISLVRAECVKLAKLILERDHHDNSELERILKEAKEDALPEVRFAEITHG
jgi:hypothetical protein